MSGHSKWATIKHKKALTDAKKGKEFSKLAKLISVESRLAKGDVNSPSLKAMIEKAKAANVPKENIERAVAKGKGGQGGEMITITYELYGPGGVAILADTITDNNNRTNQELKHLVSKIGYQIAEPGAASWAFKKDHMEWVPVTMVPISDDDAEKLDELVNALEEHDDVQAVYTNAE
ncbi:MAG: YebC/PmpR family DNA-binding transcriptional regulator [Candidatus Pacebacteria bacterium]|nr:YebC/PmpR family DNA-binding transcriptional regulator [Candidatus Paceibacterota bacterium]